MNVYEKFYENIYEYMQEISSIFICQILCKIINTFQQLLSALSCAQNHTIAVIQHSLLSIVVYER